MPRIPTSILLFLLCAGVNAAVFHVREGAAGNKSGADWTNAFPSLPPTLVRGSTYYIADGTYGGYTFDDPEQGGTPVTLKKAIPADHGSPAGWQDSMGDDAAVFTGTLMFKAGYYTIDGQVGTMRSGHGFRIEFTSGNNLKHIAALKGIDRVVIRHLEAKGAGEDRKNSSDDIVYVVTDLSNKSQYWEFSHVWLHDVNRTCFLLYCTDHFIIENSVIEKRHTDGTVHGELFSINNSGQGAETVIRNNIIADCAGTGMLAIKDFPQSGFYIYGNVFYQSSKRYMTSNGVICMTGSGGTTTDTKIFGNTFVDTYGIGGRLNPAIGFLPHSTSGNEAYNNIFFNTGGVMGLERQDWNLYDNAGLAGRESHGQAWTGGTELFVDYDKREFHLAKATRPGMAIDPKTPWRVTFSGAPLDMRLSVDIRGRIRGKDGVWDVGAFEFDADPDARQ